jgi:LysM repeat protein
MSRRPAQPSAFGGVVIALALALIMAGALLLAALDAGGQLPRAPGRTPSATPYAVQQRDVTVILPLITALPSATPQPTQELPTPEIITVVPTGTPVTNGSVLPTPCQPPAGWVRIVIQAGETLARLASSTGTTVEALRIANCLSGTTILAGQSLWVPSAPPPLPTSPAQCGPPWGWVLYTVQAGDTLFSIAQRHGVGYLDLMVANCLTSYYIYAGQPLWVPPTSYVTATSSPTSAPPDTDTPEPPGPTDTPEPPSTRRPSPTAPPPTATATRPAPPTATATGTPLPPPTGTSTALPPTATATRPAPTATVTATNTPLPPPTATNTAVPLPTSTPTAPPPPPTATDTPAPPPTATDTPAPPPPTLTDTPPPLPPTPTFTPTP